MKVGIFIADSNGGYPVPAVKGGAVSTLVEHLVNGNNKKKLIKLEVISFYSEDAEEQSKKYPYIKFVWIRVPKVITWIDLAIFFTIKKIFKKRKLISYKSICSLLYYIIKATKIIQKNRYDKVVLENNIPLAWIIKESKYKGDYYYHLHNVPRINAGCKNVFQNANAILCVSKYVAKQIQSFDSPIGPIKQYKIKILYNCIDIKHFHNIEDKRIIEEKKKEYGINKKDKIVIFVGRLSEEKGIDVLLNAIIKMQRKDIKVFIVGSLMHDLNIKDDYQRKIYELGTKLKHQIIFTGYISQKDLPILYCMSDVAVLPSMWDEPAGLTILEAVSCGIPVITTNSGGIPEYVQNKAIILERNEELVENIARNIERVIGNCNKEINNNDVGEPFLDKYNAENYIDKFVECLNDEK